VNVVLSVLLYSKLILQIVCSVQLNCTHINYKERECVTLILRMLLYRILCVHIVYRMQPISTYSNYRETE